MFRRMRFNSSNISLKRPTAVGATDFLRRNERMARLQKDCADCLPAMFKHCEILAFEDSQLILSVPTTALAAKLKQQLPKLQDTLARRGWQVAAVKLKVQMTKAVEIKEKMRALELPPAAVEAFDQLSSSLEASPQNSPLIDAVKAMVARRRAGGG
jgi:hypothetical protein